ncbi:MAG: ImmA/IrrE family metallo-endopeptidase [Magnetococcales bacterium]|nr:ImmA/IrrE family metallo-endopeptidase [Magnetococcales bacterium]
MASGVPESGLKFSEIEETAEEFARTYQFNPQRDDIRELVEKLNGQFKLTSDPMYQDGGSMRAWRAGHFIIYLSPFTGVLRDNFTIAHELGHLNLHVPKYFEQNPTCEEVRVNRFGNDKPELQANRFAAALLMPNKAFTSIGQQTEWNIPALSAWFSVSQSAAQYRADFLRR